VVSFVNRSIYPQVKNPFYPLDRRLDGFQSRSGHGGEEKNCQPLPGIEPSIIQPVAQRYTIELSRLQRCNRTRKFNIAKFMILIHGRSTLFITITSYYPPIFFSVFRLEAFYEILQPKFSMFITIPAQYSSLHSTIPTIRNKSKGKIKR
jgi:hypothetical protein